MGKHCCYADCNSDSRYSHKPHMQDVFFIPFPKPSMKPEKCDRWIVACGRKFFTRDCVTKDTYICSKHFIGGKGPTSDHPDPIPATTDCQDQASRLSRKRKYPSLKVNPLVPVSEHEAQQQAAEALLELAANFKSEQNAEAVDEEMSCALKMENQFFKTEEDQKDLDASEFLTIELNESQEAFHEGQDEDEINHS